MALKISSDAHQSGEALCVGFVSDVDLSDCTVVGRVSVAKGEAVEVPATMDDPVSGKLVSGYVAFAGTLFPTAGDRYEGTIVVTKPGAPWSPLKENFSGKVGTAV